MELNAWGDFLRWGRENREVDDDSLYFFSRVLKNVFNRLYDLIYKLRMFLNPDRQESTPDSGFGYEADFAADLAEQ